MRTDDNVIANEPSTLPAHLRGLLQADAYPHTAGPLEIIETNLSWIILTGIFAYKIKKPVTAHHLDASTLAQRRRYCNEEIRLNRRLAPELYLDVAAITRNNGRLLLDGTGSVLEYAVRMRQFDRRDELLCLLERKQVSAYEMAGLGELLADFHARASIASSDSADAWTSRTLATVLGNLAQLIAQLPVTVAPALGPLIDWTHDSAQTLQASLKARAIHGFVRECHGDLHAGNIVCLHNRLVPFDCVEFDPESRWIDVIADVAVLFMDLIGHDRPDLAQTMLSRYLKSTRDSTGMRVLPFYAVHAAVVSASRDASSAEATPARAPELETRIRRYLDMANRLIAKPPRATQAEGVLEGSSWA